MNVANTSISTMSSPGCPWLARLAALLVLSFLAGNVATSLCDLAGGQSFELTCQSCSQDQESSYDCDCADPDGTVAAIDPSNLSGPIVSQRAGILSVDDKAREGVASSVDHPPRLV